MSEMHWNLDIAGLTLTLRGPETWISPFAGAWSDWKGDSPGWEVRCIADPSLPKPETFYYQARPRFAAGCCLLEVPGFSGFVDPAAQRALLRAHPSGTPGDIAYFLRTAFALAAFDASWLLFHAAGILHREQAYVLFGNSGSGKTTAARLSVGKPVLNDDLLLLRPNDAGWEVWATPFGKRRSREVTHAPLRVLLRLVQSLQDRVEPLSRAQALAGLLANSPVVNADPTRAPGLLTWWEGVLEEVPAYRLHFIKDNSFWEVLDAHLA